jgi:hypothetical protein
MREYYLAFILFPILLLRVETNKTKKEQRETLNFCYLLFATNPIYYLLLFLLKFDFKSS